MERETLKQAIRRYTTVLRFISDDRAMAVPNGRARWDRGTASV